jgi:hypothetical protein
MYRMTGMQLTSVHSIHCCIDIENSADVHMLLHTNIWFSRTLPPLLRLLEENSGMQGTANKYGMHSSACINQSPRFQQLSRQGFCGN